MRGITASQAKLSHTVQWTKQLRAGSDPSWSWVKCRSYLWKVFTYGLMNSTVLYLRLCALTTETQWFSHMIGVKTVSSRVRIYRREYMEFNELNHLLCTDVLRETWDFCMIGMPMLFRWFSADDNFFFFTLLMFLPHELLRPLFRSNFDCLPSCLHVNCKKPSNLEGAYLTLKWK